MFMTLFYEKRRSFRIELLLVIALWVSNLIERSPSLDTMIFSTLFSCLPRSITQALVLLRLTKMHTSPLAPVSPPAAALSP